MFKARKRHLFLLKTVRYVIYLSANLHKFHKIAPVSKNQQKLCAILHLAIPHPFCYNYKCQEGNGNSPEC